MSWLPSKTAPSSITRALHWLHYASRKRHTVRTAVPVDIPPCATRLAVVIST